MIRYANRKDTNDSALANIARQCGAYVVNLVPGQGADWLLVYRGRVFIVEIKDGSKAKSARKLTKSEQDLKAQCEYRGVQFHEIKNADELLRLLAA